MTLAFSPEANVHLRSEPSGDHLFSRSHVMSPQESAYSGIFRHIQGSWSVLTWTEADLLCVRLTLRSVKQTHNHDALDMRCRSILSGWGGLNMHTGSNLK